MENKIKTIAQELANVTLNENREFIAKVTKGLNDEQLFTMCMAMAMISVKNNAEQIEAAMSM